MALDEGRFQKHAIFRTIIPWLAASKLTMLIISTAALLAGAACLALLRRTWDEAGKKAVVRSLQMDAFGFLRPEAVQTDLTVVELIKNNMRDRLKQQGSIAAAASTGLPGPESLVNGTIYLPWFTVSAGAIDNPSLFTAQRTAFEIQWSKLEDYFMEARLPPHQDFYSVNLVRHAMDKEEWEREMRSKNEGTADAGDEYSQLTPAFERYVVSEWEKRSRARLDEVGARMVLERHINYARSYTDTVSTQQPPAPDPNSMDVDTSSSASGAPTMQMLNEQLGNAYWGADTVDGLSQITDSRRRLVYVCVDPSGDGTASDCVFVSFISRAAVTREQIQSVQGYARTLQVAESVCSYLSPVQTMVRFQLFFVTPRQRVQLVVRVRGGVK